MINEEIKLRWWEEIYYTIRRFFKFKIAYIPLNIKSFFQRGKRGWAYSDTWGLDYHLNNVIPQALRHLGKNCLGCPHEFFNDEDKGNECREWEKILITMAEGFEANKKVIEFEWETEEERLELWKKWEKGAELFIRYYNNLWD